MRLLLDTHVLIWWPSQDQRLKSSVIVELENSDNEVFYSPVSTAELATKLAIKKLFLSKSVEQIVGFLEKMGVRELPLVYKHTLFLQQLPLLHKDPFDRLLVAQAIDEKMTLITQDDIIK